MNMNTTVLTTDETCHRRRRSRSSLYADTLNGLCTKSVKTGPRTAGWPEHEIEAINRAYIAGASLDEIRERLVDALPLVREHVYHPDFGGSFSLKAVLPALVPDMGYEALEVAGGRAASLALDRLMFGSDEVSADERARTREALLSYCGTDTLGVVRLIQRLETLANG